ncbi:hypothetical protein BKA62DRAFT_764885 [Auriculariales sp. MPI-PUGE-AT-0066]|nr:hypothetical protein BKA62DRAFT_764885 [Auriculariales sp. MPI-PUGE-AT-0066]
MPSPRRPRPSPLLLAQGPTPPRGAPKHRMPARPAPTAVPVPGSPPSSPDASTMTRSMHVKQRSRTLEVAVPSPAAVVAVVPRGRIRAPWDMGLAFGQAIPVDTVKLAPPPRAAVAGFSSAFSLAVY